MKWPTIHKRALDMSIVGDAPTDARRSMGSPRRGEPDPEIARRQRLHRRVAGLCIGAVFLVGLAAALVGRGGYVELRRLSAERDAARQAVALQRARVEAEERAVRALQGEPEARERIAREQLGYTRPGEVTFVLPEETPADGGGTENGRNNNGSTDGGEP